MTPSNSYFAARELIDAGIPVTLILDSAVAFAMERVDMVLVGAEGVVESGGIINLVRGILCEQVYGLELPNSNASLFMVSLC